MEHSFVTKNLAVGYGKHILIHDISICLEKGTILTLIGPNGAGKSTILKSITHQLSPMGGTVSICGRDLSAWSPREIAKQMAVVLTDRIRPELMTCEEVVAMGRYPYTNLFGKLTAADKTAVHRALERVHALDLALQDFSTLSDGQRQRIMLARAICQEPEILVLDEPTAYLDIRYKVELLEILRDMAKKQNITVILSLHEIDLAIKISDQLLCVKGDTIYASGPPDAILKQHTIESLYDMKTSSYDLLFGSMELAKPAGEPQVFVVGGAGFGIPCYRALQRRDIPFAAGILFRHDIDCPVAMALSDHVITTPAFEPAAPSCFAAASELLLRCQAVIDAGTPHGTFNQMNRQLLQLARSRGIPIHLHTLRKDVSV